MLTRLGIAYSDNLQAQYPILHRKLQRRSNLELQWICLGPNSTFFAKWENDEAYLLGPDITSVINKVKGDGISAVALGKDETYIIVHGDKMAWNLKGHYLLLTSTLRKAESPPEVRFCSVRREPFLFFVGSLTFCGRR